MRRHELSDKEWELIEPYLPSNERHEGHPWGDHRIFLNGMIYRLATGAAWRDLPERFGKWNSIYQRFRRWSKSGLLEQIALVLQAELEARGRIDWNLWCIDATNVRATKAAAGALKKRRKHKQILSRAS